MSIGFEKLPTIGANPRQALGGSASLRAYSLGAAASQPSGVVNSSMSILVNRSRRFDINVFTLLPPEWVDIPSSEERHDAEIHVQAFLFNTFAAIYNLAWIWVSEKNIRKPDGSELAHRHVGLRKERWPGIAHDMARPGITRRVVAPAADRRRRPPGCMHHPGD